jgi:hypothetical protein
MSNWARVRSISFSRLRPGPTNRSASGTCWLGSGRRRWWKKAVCAFTLPPCARHSATERTARTTSRRLPVGAIVSLHRSRGPARRLPRLCRRPGPFATPTYKLEPLAVPPDDPALTASVVETFPAIQVFVERAVAGGARLDLSDANAAVVADICRKLDGVALAIELAAGRVGAYGLQQTAALLDQRLTLLWPGQRTAPPRQKTLHATLEWSYALLRTRTSGRRTSVMGATPTSPHLGRKETVSFGHAARWSGHAQRLKLNIESVLGRGRP